MYFRVLSLVFLVVVFIPCGCALKHEVIGQYYLDARKYERGIESFKEEIRAKPDEPRVNYYLGRCYLGDGKYKEAFQYLHRAVELAPKNADYHFWLGVAYSANQNPGLERKSYLKALSLNARHASALIYVGHSHFEKGELKAALKSYSDALKLEPDSPQALHNRAMILKRLGRTPEEKIAWKAYLNLYPSGGWARSAAEHLNDEGDFEYRNHILGHRQVTLKSIQFEPFSANLEKTSRPTLDLLGTVLINKQELVLHIVSYQKNNSKLAKARALSIRDYLKGKFSKIVPSQLKVSWFGEHEQVKVSEKKHTLDQSVIFITETRK